MRRGEQRPHPRYGGVFGAGRGGDGELAHPPPGLGLVKPGVAKRREHFRELALVSADAAAGTGWRARGG